MDLSKYKDKGKIGLDNLGNTCFLNACMQVLNHTYELNSFLDSEKYKRTFKENIPDSNILIEWDDLRKVMWSGNGVVSPNRFVHNVHKIASIKGRDIFTGVESNLLDDSGTYYVRISAINAVGMGKAKASTPTKVTLANAVPEVPKASPVNPAPVVLVES
jgi:hypothetical protein